MVQVASRPRRVYSAEQFTLGTFADALRLTERDIRERITAFVARSLQP